MLKEDIPYYEECDFGYYEWFVEKSNDEIVIHKIATLAPFKRILSDKDYKVDIKYLPGLRNKERFLDRCEAYKIVKEHWDPNNNMNNYLNYLRIKI